MVEYVVMQIKTEDFESYTGKLNRCKIVETAENQRF